MAPSVLAAFHAAGLDSVVPILLALHALASATDAALPQPKPGSHWLPLRKLVSIAAGNVFNATNALQPAMLTWVQRVAQLLVALLPPATLPTAAPPAMPPMPVMPPAAPTPVQPPVSSPAFFPVAAPVLPVPPFPQDVP